MNNEIQINEEILSINNPEEINENLIDESSEEEIIEEKSQKRLRKIMYSLSSQYLTVNNIILSDKKEILIFFRENRTEMLKYMEEVSPEFSEYYTNKEYTSIIGNLFLEDSEIKGDAADKKKYEKDVSYEIKENIYSLKEKMNELCDFYINNNNNISLDDSKEFSKTFKKKKSEIFTYINDCYPKFNEYLNDPQYEYTVNNTFALYCRNHMNDISKKKQIKEENIVLTDKEKKEIKNKVYEKLDIFKKENREYFTKLKVFNANFNATKRREILKNILNKYKEDLKYDSIICGFAHRYYGKERKKLVLVSNLLKTSMDEEEKERLKKIKIEAKGVLNDYLSHIKDEFQNIEDLNKHFNCNIRDDLLKDLKRKYQIAQNSEENGIIKHIGGCVYGLEFARFKKEK